MSESAATSESSEDFNHTRADIDDVTTEFSVTIPQSEFSKRIEQAAKEIAPTVTIKGFRKGKAPAKMVKKIYGDRIRGDVAQRLVSETLYQALQKESIEHTVGDPELTIQSMVEEEDFAYKAKVFLPPKPEIKDYDAFEVELEEAEVADDDVSKAIDEMLLAQATPQKVTGRDVLQENDIISGTIAVQVEGEDEGKEEPLVSKLGEEKLPEELESGVIGMKVGETKEITSVVADDHRDEELRGKAVTYKVVLNEIQEQILPELTDDFVKTLGMEAETVLELRLKMREKLEHNAKSAEQTETQSQILKELLSRNPFAVPQNMVDSEIRGMLVQNGFVNPQKMDVSKINVEPFREHFGEVAEERVRIAIMVERIAEQEEITFSDEEAEKTVTDLSEEHGIPREEVERLLLSDGRKENFIREHRQKKALELLESRAKISRVKKKEEEVKDG